MNNEIVNRIIRDINHRTATYTDQILDQGFTATNAQILDVIRTVGVTAESPRRIIVSVADTPGGRIHGRNVLSHLASAVNLHAAGIPPHIADHAEIVAVDGTHTAITY